MTKLEKLKRQFIVDVAPPSAARAPRVILRCEGCGKESPKRCSACGGPRTTLPPSWSQFGITRYEDSPTTNASWCKKCGDREWAKVKEEARDAE